ncbi:MAG: glycosyltransferase family 4 protein [Patescibacteria group bacterium]
METIGLINIFSKRSGGNIYKNQVINTLSGTFDVEYVNLEANYFKNRYLKSLESFIKLLFFRGKKDLWIRDFYSTITLNKKNTRGKNLTLIFHIDFSGFRLIPRLLLPLLEKTFFYIQVKRADATVVISEYWKNYFLEKGYKNVCKIYCGFSMNNFNITAEEVSEFKKKYKLEGKPIVYLGNCQKPKGVVDAYEALKDLDVYLVTSGRKEVEVPTLNLDLDYKNYLILLKASSVVVTMSKFKEGWSMTTHEAMLLKVPTIGSGMGGMRELLENGGQIICTDFKELKQKVEYLLNNSEERKKIGQIGYNYAKDFTIERFNQEWLDLINNVLR